jgi:adenylylsulfate kinase
MASYANPAVIWLTGLSGAGKTTIAHDMIKQLKMSGIAPVFLDGDQIRRSLKQLDFSEAARKAHNLRVGQMASALEKRGKVVIVSLISPYADIRAEVRSLCETFVEVYVQTPLELCIQPRSKGFVQKSNIRPNTTFYRHYGSVLSACKSRSNRVYRLHVGVGLR